MVTDLSLFLRKFEKIHKGGCRRRYIKTWWNRREICNRLFQIGENVFKIQSFPRISSVIGVKKFGKLGYRCALEICNHLLPD